jgi:cation:H+ antiporter
MYIWFLTALVPLHGTDTLVSKDIPMAAVEHLISQNIVAAWIILAIAFLVLSKCADLFVESAVGLAERFNVPKLIIGIIIVSLATTAPELSVSLLSALKGNPEMALGNAVGSVICDDGLALGFAGVFAAVPIAISPAVLTLSGAFLLGIELLLFGFVVFDQTLSRAEGILLVALFAGYLFLLYRQYRRGKAVDSLVTPGTEPPPALTVPALTGLFIVGLVGLILSSKVIVSSATAIAYWLAIPESIIALTLVALGTSIPEVATCITATRKKQGEIAVGNILGADIMNLCWVAGASAIANDLVIEKKGIFFMFPSMFVIVVGMLVMLRIGYNLNRKKGAALLGLYALYIASFFFVFQPG